MSDYAVVNPATGETLATYDTMTDEAVEGRDAFLQRRSPDWSPFPYYF